MPEYNGTVLAVDDDPVILKLLETALTKNNYEVLLARDGMAGWELLDEHDSVIDAVLLDRRMPRLDGLELLRRIKDDPAKQRIPVIMETAARARHEIVEGIDAGAYYYITKPFHVDILLSIVETAVRDYRYQSMLRTEVDRNRQMLGLVSGATFEFRTLEQAQDLAVFIAAFYPEPDNVVLGLSELLVNAVEHGNLGIGYERKTELTRQGRWREEIESLLHDSDHADRTVRVSYERTATELRLIIRDEGEGFDPAPYMQLDPDRVTDNHGRGIAMANMVSFDAIEYRAGGTEVCCTVRLRESAS